MKFIITLLVITFTLSLDAQHWGIKGGLAYSNLSVRNGDLDDSAGRLGFTAGVYANYPFLGILSFQPEILYTQKGGRATFSDVTIKTRSNYFEIPLGVQLNIIDAVYIYAGPQFSYLTNISVDYSLGALVVSNDKDESNYERIDAAIFGGAGWQNDKVFIDARITQGLVNYDDRDDNIEIPTELRNLRNFTFSLTGGLKF